VITLVYGAGRNRDNPCKCIVFSKLDSHPYVNEWNTPFLQSLDN